MKDLKIEGAERMFRNALKQQQTYSKSLEPAITMAAGAYIAYTLCVRSIAERGSINQVVTSREGNDQYRPYPDVQLFQPLLNAYNNSLRALGLTVITLEQVDDNPLTALVNKVNEVDNG